jgi:hypothetical protein
MDLLALTSYPFALTGTDRTADLRDDFFPRVLAFLSGKRFGLSESGWPALDAFDGEEGQADFLAQAAGRLTRSRGWIGICPAGLECTISTRTTQRG